MQAFAMEVTRGLGELLKIPEPSARYLLALFIAYIFSIVYFVLLQKVSSTVKSIYFAASGIWTLYFVFGFSIWHFSLDIVAVYIFFVILGPTLLTLTLTWILTMGHLLVGYYIVTMSNQVHPIFWTIPHCVLVLKLIGLAYNLYDGQKNQDLLSADQKATCLTATPSFIEIMGFCCHYGTVLAGPQFSFKRYQNFVSGQLFDSSKTKGSLFAGVQRMILGVFMALLYAFLNNYFPQKYILSNEFSDLSFIIKLFYMVIISNLALRRLIAVWLLAEGACIVTGISYCEKTRGYDWSGITNVIVLDFELSITLQGIIDSFNVNTNNWVKCYVFKRLKWIGNRQISAILSLFFLSLWHGLWIGYALNFFMEFFDIMMEQQFKMVAAKRFGLSREKMPWIVYAPVVFVLFAVRHVLLAYPVMLFILLSWEACFKFMKSVYFFGHIVPIIWFIAFFAFLKPSKKKSL